MDRSAPPLGGYLLLALFFVGLFGLQWLYYAIFISNGVRTQGVIVNTHVVDCGKGKSDAVSVRFTDRGGQVHTGIEGGCPQPLHGSPGDSVTIVYDPNNPSKIASPDDAQYFVPWTILSGLIALLLLPFWIRKRMRKPKHLEAWSLSGFKEPPLFHD